MNVVDSSLYRGAVVSCLVFPHQTAAVINQLFRQSAGFRDVGDGPRMEFKIRQKLSGTGIRYACLFHGDLRQNADTGEPFNGMDQNKGLASVIHDTPVQPYRGLVISGLYIGHKQKSGISLHGYFPIIFPLKKEFFLPDMAEVFRLHIESAFGDLICASAEAGKKDMKIKPDIFGFYLRICGEQRKILLFFSVGQRRFFRKLTAVQPSGTKRSDKDNQMIRKCKAVFCKKAVSHEADRMVGRRAEHFTDNVIFTFCSVQGNRQIKFFRIPLKADRINGKPGTDIQKSHINRTFHRYTSIHSIPVSS